MQNLGQRLCKLKDFVQRRLTETGVPSVSVAIAREGEIVWEEAFGWADLEARIPATPHTPYSLASVSKPITATGLMVLCERGLVNLDRPIDDYLGPAGLTARIGRAEDATVRRVASHSAGLPLHYQFFYADEPYPRPPMGETIRRYANLITPPGERYQYSNLGFGLLDHVISRVSGAAYPDFMRSEVFVPLGMMRASVGIGPGLEPDCARRYSPSRRPLPFYDFDHPGGSAIFCSAHDLVRFGLFHLGLRLSDQRPILTGAGIAEMHAPVVKVSPGNWYGLGWRITESDSGYRTLGHSGSMDGVRTELVLVPAQGVAVAVLVNSRSDLALEVARQALAAALPGFAPSKSDALAQATQPAPFVPPSELLGKWCGVISTYRADLPFLLIFQPDGDVHVRLGDQLETLVTDTRFENGTLTGRFQGGIGTADANRRPHHLHLNLIPRGRVLNGAVSAISVPADRMGNALSHWAELRAV